MNTENRSQNQNSTIHFSLLLGALFSNMRLSSTHKHTIQSNTNRVQFSNDVAVDRCTTHERHITTNEHPSMSSVTRIPLLSLVEIHPYNRCVGI